MHPSIHPSRQAGIGRSMDGWMDGWMGGGTEGRTDRRIDGVDDGMDDGMGGGMDGGMDGESWLAGSLGGWADGRTDGWMDGHVIEGCENSGSYRQRGRGIQCRFGKPYANNLGCWSLGCWLGASGARGLRAHSSAWLASGARKPKLCSCGALRWLRPVPFQLFVPRPPLQRPSTQALRAFGV